MGHGELHRWTGFAACRDHQAPYTQKQLARSYPLSPAIYCPLNPDFKVNLDPTIVRERKRNIAFPLLRGYGLPVVALALEVFVVAVLLFHVTTYILWAYEVRVHGAARSPEPRLPGIVAWIGEGLAILLTMAAWPFGWLALGQPGPRLGPKRPVVLVHGWGLNRASMILLAARLRRDGRQVYCINYPSTGGDTATKAGHLCIRLRAVVEATGARSLDVVAHSLGGIVVREAARQPDCLGLLENVVTLGSPHQGTNLAAFLDWPRLVQLRPDSSYLTRLCQDDPLAVRGRVTAISSSFDAIVFPEERAYYPAAFNARLDYIGHFGLLYSDRVYRLVKENLDVEPSASVPATGG